jgi:hypothetical protein
VRELGFSEEQYEGRERSDGWTMLRYKACRQLAFVLGLVYNRAVRKNASQDLHIRSLLANERLTKFTQTVSAYVAVGFALFAGHIKALRWIMQKWFYWLAPKCSHEEIYRKFKPSLVVTCTFGLGIDGILMAEARQNGVQIVTAVQSWDKTSTKGYPAVFPDAAILWSDVTADEAAIYLDMPRKSLHVEGAPLWDKHFSGTRQRDRAAFLGAYGLDPATKLIAVSIGSPCYHDGNLRLIDFLIEQADSGQLKNPVSFIFRQHPGYLFYEREKSDMLKFIQKKSPSLNVAFMDVELSEHGGELMYREADSESLCELLAYCDLSISIVSSHLIEASIFDKPAINIEYGQWTNDMYDFDLSKYSAEHLSRIYRAQAVYRASSEHDLIAMVNEALTYPNKMSKARKTLIAQEVPVNQGNAAIRVSERMVSFAQAAMKESGRLK